MPEPATFTKGDRVEINPSTNLSGYGVFIVIGEALPGLLWAVPEHSFHPGRHVVIAKPVLLSADCLIGLR